MSRAEIKAGLEAVPIDALLLGSVSKASRLTPKQRKFAEALAMGESKAGAYRAAYNTHTRPEIQSRRGQELAKHSAVAAQIEALRLAAEAQRHATPAALRALVIQRLTEHAISDEVQPAQRLKALELLGKVTEVAAFTERREIVRTIDEAGARRALLESLRQALRSTSIDVPARAVSDTEDVQISSPADPGAVDEGPGSEATQGRPPRVRDAHARDLLSIPHIQSAVSDVTQTGPGAASVTGVTVNGESSECVTEGGGGVEILDVVEDVEVGKPPGSDLEV